MGSDPRIARVELTAPAAALLRRLARQHGPLMFHQSGGCCDGSAPMCYPRGEFRVGAADVLLGVVDEDTPFWMSADQFLYWQHTHLTVDIVPGRGSGFSVEAPEGVRFLIRSRLLTDAELARIDAEPPLPTGAVRTDERQDDRQDDRHGNRLPRSEPGRGGRGG